MITFDNVSVFNFEGAIRGARNPLNSWNQMDSRFGLQNDDRDDWAMDRLYSVRNKWMEYNGYGNLDDCETTTDKDRWLTEAKHIEDWLWDSSSLEMNGPYTNRFYMGPKDLSLAQRLIRAGDDESKFMRQIFVSVNITAPLYW